MLGRVAPQRADDPVEINQPLARDVLDAADDLRSHGRVVATGDTRRARLDGDGAELVRQHIMQLAGDASPFLVVHEPGRCRGCIPVGGRYLAEARCDRQERQRQRLRAEAVRGDEHGPGPDNGGHGQDPGGPAQPGPAPRPQAKRTHQRGRRGGEQVQAKAGPDGQHARGERGGQHGPAAPPQEWHRLREHEQHEAEHGWRRSAVPWRPPPPRHIRSGPAEQASHDEPVGNLRALHCRCAVRRRRARAAASSCCTA